MAASRSAATELLLIRSIITGQSSENKTVFLQQQMEAIREELYGEDDDAQTFKKRAEKVNFPENIRKYFDKELDKLRRLNTQSPDYSIQYSFLDTILELPWGIYSEANKDIEKAETILNEDHYGLEKVKERVLEFLAVRAYSIKENGVCQRKKQFFSNLHRKRRVRLIAASLFSEDRSTGSQ